MNTEYSSKLPEELFVSAVGQAKHLEATISVRREYDSPWDSVYSQTLPEDLNCKGTVGSELQMLHFISSFPDTIVRKKNLALFSPSVIRSAIDYKVDGSNTSNATSFLNLAIELGLAAYKDEAGLSELIADFQNFSHIEGLSVLPVFQKPDYVTWEAMDPKLSEATASSLVSRFEGIDVLFIPLAHGGIAAGIDVFLRYCDITKSNTSVFYPVRFSRYKMKDEVPRITPNEKIWLQEQASAREVVIFDEDQSTGITLRSAQRYFDSEIFPGRTIQTAFNIGVGLK